MAQARGVVRVMSERKISWTEVDSLFPDVRTEWAEMNRTEEYGYRLGPHLNPTGDVTEGPVEPWLITWQSAVGEPIEWFLEIRSTLGHFPCDPDPVEWEITPHWRRNILGDWWSPYPLPKKMSSYSMFIHRYGSGSLP